MSDSATEVASGISEEGVEVDLRKEADGHFTAIIRLPLRNLIRENVEKAMVEIHREITKDVTEIVTESWRPLRNRFKALVVEIVNEAFIVKPKASDNPTVHESLDADEKLRRLVLSPKALSETDGDGQ